MRRIPYFAGVGLISLLAVGVSQFNPAQLIRPAVDLHPTSTPSLEPRLYGKAYCVRVGGQRRINIGIFAENFDMIYPSKAFVRFLLKESSSNIATQIGKESPITQNLLTNGINGGVEVPSKGLRMFAEGQEWQIRAVISLDRQQIDTFEAKRLRLECE